MTPKKKNEKELKQEIKIPEEISVIIRGKEIVLKKADRELRRKLNPLLELKIEDNNIIIRSKKTSKKQRKNFGTLKAHLKNMIKGLEEDFVYELQVANVHFPMNISFDKENREFFVKNFLGEKKDRKIKIREGVELQIDKGVIEIRSPDIEKAGQTAADIEKGTKVRNKDRRIFQDGIFITKKPRRNIL